MNGMEIMIERMLKSSGFDLGKLVGDFTNLKTFVEKTLGNIDQRLSNIEFLQGEIWKKMSTEPIPQLPPTAQPAQPLHQPTPSEPLPMQPAQPPAQPAQPKLPPNLFLQPPKQ